MPKAKQALRSMPKLMRVLAPTAGSRYMARSVTLSRRTRSARSLSVSGFKPSSRAMRRSLCGSGSSKLATDAKECQTSTLKARAVSTIAASPESAAPASSASLMAFRCFMKNRRGSEVLQRHLSVTVSCALGGTKSHDNESAPFSPQAAPLLNPPTHRTTWTSSTRLPSPACRPLPLTEKMRASHSPSP